jgi:molecular chaperone GrpE
MSSPAQPGADDAAQATSSGGAELESLQAALAAAQSAAAEHKDLYMRALAEMENIRKRSSRDIEQAHKYAIERFANELVGVKDSLELGLAAAGTGDTQSLLTGMEATLKLLAKAFEKAGIVELVPQGQAFNPELHEAMVTQESKDQPANSVLQVIQKGYQLNGRLLRPARVIVAREASDA